MWSVSCIDIIAQVSVARWSVFLFLDVPAVKLKACVRYFLSNFYLSPNDSPSKNMKNVSYFI